MFHNHHVSSALKGPLHMEKLLASLPHGGGLLYLGFSLFHQKAAVREHTVNLFNQLRAYPVSLFFDR